MRAERSWLLACALFTSVSQADPLYVIEQLVVSVSGEPGGSGEKVASIKSGDAVELLEKHNGDAHVRLANGTEGWVKASYLSAQEPLQKRLTDRTAEVERLKQEMSRLQTELTATRNQAAGAGASARAAEAANAPLHEPSYFMTEPEQPGRPVWHWVVISSLLTLGIGFALGWWVLDRRIRRKYGGLRIY